MAPESNYVSMHGFTLLEVLVALAIVALGLMAVFGQLNQTAAGVIRLRDQTFAHWVAQDRLAEIRLSGQFPEIGERQGEVEMAKVNWTYTVNVSAIEVQGFKPENVRKVEVSVSVGDEAERPVTSLTGFVVQQDTATSNPGSAATDWAPIGPEGEDDGQ
jgi:general secretion pathway protein I